jgi:hypothetical protein
MSQRNQLDHIHRRILYLNQLINHRRERELRERNQQRLRFLQRGRGTQPRKVISDYYQIKLNRTRNSRKFKTKQNVFNVTFKPLPDSSSIRRLFRDLLKNVKQKMEASPKTTSV